MNTDHATCPESKSRPITPEELKLLEKVAQARQEQKKIERQEQCEKESLKQKDRIKAQRQKIEPIFEDVFRPIIDHSLKKDGNITEKCLEFNMPDNKGVFARALGKKRESTKMPFDVWFRNIWNQPFNFTFETEETKALPDSDFLDWDYGILAFLESISEYYKKLGFSVTIKGYVITISWT